MTTQSTKNTPLSILLILLTLNSIVAQQNSKLDGWVVLQNSKWKTGKVEYIANAQVRATLSTPTLSDSKGWFSLAFLNVPNGRKVKLSVAKTGLKVVNEKVVEEAAFTGHAEELKIVMCDAADFEMAFNNYYQVSQKELQKTFDRRLAVLNRNNAAEKNALLDSMNREMKRAVSTREEAIALLEEQRKHLETQAWDLAEAFSVVNLDDQSETYQRAFRAFTEGAIQRTIDILNDANIEKNMADNNRQIALIDSTTLVLASKKDSALLKKAQLVKEAVLNAQAYSLQYDYNQAQHWYNVAIQNDSLNFALLNEYTAYLYDLGEFEKSYNINKITLERVLRLRQTADSLRYTEGYAVALFYRASLLSRQAKDFVPTQNACLEAIGFYENFAPNDTLRRLQLARLQSDLAQAYGNMATDAGDSASFVWYSRAIQLLAQPVTSPRFGNDYLLAKAIAHLGLGNMHRYANQLQDAENQCLSSITLRRQLFQRDSNRYAHLLGLGLTMLSAVYIENRAYTRAIDSLNQAIWYSLVSRNSSFQYSFKEVIRAQSYLAEVFIKIDSFDLAEFTLDSMERNMNLYDSLVTLDKDWLAGYFNTYARFKNELIFNYLLQQQFEKALNKSQETYQKYPQSSDIIRMYGLALIFNGQYDQTIRVIGSNDSKNKLIPELKTLIKDLEARQVIHPDFLRLKSYYNF